MAALRRGLLVRPLHHSLVTNAVHALFPNQADLVDHVLGKSRNSKHRCAERASAKIASGVKYRPRLDLLCISLTVDIHSDFAESGHRLILVLTHHVSHLLVVAQAHKPGMPQVTVWRPIDKLKLTHECWLKPSAFLHLFGCQTLTPAATLSFGEVGKRARSVSKPLNRLNI